MKKKDLTLYLGGTRSGKSALAEAQAKRGEKGPVFYVATAAVQPDDAAMTERIARHRSRRPKNWHTIECPLNPGAAITAALENLPESGLAEKSTILLDCVTLWVSNIQNNLPPPGTLPMLEAAVRAEVGALLALIARSQCRWILVSGETGLGGIAPTPIGRDFCDGLGLANQLIAAQARTTYLVVAGKLLKLSDR